MSERRPCSPLQNHFQPIENSHLNKNSNPPLRLKPRLECTTVSRNVRECEEGYAGDSLSSASANVGAVIAHRTGSSSHAPITVRPPALSRRRPTLTVPLHLKCINTNPKSKTRQLGACRMPLTWCCPVLLDDRVQPSGG